MGHLQATKVAAPRTQYVTAEVPQTEKSRSNKLRLKDERGRTRVFASLPVCLRGDYLLVTRRVVGTALFMTAATVYVHPFS